MALTQNQVASILKNLKIAYTSDAIEACLASRIDNPQIVEKWFKSAFYLAAQDNRRIVTAEDVKKVFSEMRL